MAACFLWWKETENNEHISHYFKTTTVFNFLTTVHIKSNLVYFHGLENRTVSRNISSTKSLSFILKNEMFNCHFSNTRVWKASFKNETLLFISGYTTIFIIYSHFCLFNTIKNLDFSQVDYECGCGCKWFFLKISGHC